MIEFGHDVDRQSRRRLLTLVSLLPPLTGQPISVSYRQESPWFHAGSFLRERRITLHPDLRFCTDDLLRIFVHELFHFAWLRLGNTPRWSYESLLVTEFRTGVRGELGWSAEWRKEKLAERDVAARSRRWREYCCESFCDSAACLYSGVRRHPEFTLPDPAKAMRSTWFAESPVTSAIPV